MRYGGFGANATDAKRYGGSEISGFPKLANATDGLEIRRIWCNRYGRQSAMAAFDLCTDLRYGRQSAMAVFDLCTDLRYGRF